STYAVAHRRSRDVAVDPVGNATDEFAQEEGGANGAAPAIARVLEIGRVALELVLDVFEEWEPPHLLARRLDGGAEIVSGRLVRGIPTGTGVAKRDDAGPRQRRIVDDEIGLEPTGIGKCVGEDQATFRVGVDDLDTLAVERSPDVARTIGI